LKILSKNIVHSEKLLSYLPRILLTM